MNDMQNGTWEFETAESREKWFKTEADDTPRLKRRFPNFVAGFPETEHEIPSEEEFLKIDWIERLTKFKDFHRFSQENMGSKTALMLEREEGKKWFVIGWIKSKERIDWLPEWEKKT